jgi:hypothetical protein
LRPLGVAIVGRRFGEQRLIEIGAAFEAVVHARVNPSSVPALPDETIALDGSFEAPVDRKDKDPPALAILAVESATGAAQLIVSGSVSDASAISDIRAWVNGARMALTRSEAGWTARLDGAGFRTAACSLADGLVLVLARDAAGNAAAVQWPLAARAC